MSENSRLGRCSSCRFWKSATEILGERVDPAAGQEEVEAAEASIRADLSQEILNPAGAVNRGWCTLAESGQGRAPHFAVNMVTDTPARAITTHDFGCMNYAARPRRAMSEPIVDYLNYPGMGRCVGCRNWSSADNEAYALFSMYQYVGEQARMEDCQRESYTKLSPPPFSPATGGQRGWCKIASQEDNQNAKILTYDPVAGHVGALITSAGFACTQYEGTANPEITTSPDYRWLANRNKLNIWGAAASADDLYMSRNDAGQILNPEHIVNPLHELNVRSSSNPVNQALNPNPAFAAYRGQPGTPAKKPDLPEAAPQAAPARAAAPAPAKSRASEQQSRATARLAKSFDQNTRKKEGPKTGEGGGISLAKKKDPALDERRKKPSPQVKQGPAPIGPGNRRRT